MKLSRRKAMGTLVGSAMAGPSVARETIGGMRLKDTPPSMPSRYTDSGEAKSIECDPLKAAYEKQQYIKREIEKYTKIANGDFSYFEEELINRSENYKVTAHEAHIESLKSVSNVNKTRLCRERELNDIKNGWTKYAKERLFRILNSKPEDIL